MSTEYKRYLDRLNHIVFVEVVPKMAVFDYFTAHAPPVDNESTETLLWFIRSGLHSDITFSLFRLIDEHGGRNIYDFLKYTKKYFRTIPWKTPLTQADLNEQTDSLTAVEALIDRLKDRRNKFFGHYDAAFFYEPERIDTAFPFSNEDAKALIRTLQRILSAHTHAFSGTGTMSMEGVFYAATEKLFEKLR